MKRLLTFFYGFTLALALLGGSIVAAGITQISFGSSLPTNCASGNIFIKTSATAGLYWAQTPGSPCGAWAAVGGGGTGTVTHTSGALTANELVVGNGSDDLKAIAATNGQIPIGKTSDGSVNLATITAGSNISVTNGAGSITIAASGSAASVGLVGPLESHTASSSSSLDFTTCISSTYDEYVVDVVSLVPGTNAVDLWLRFSSNGGSTFITSTNYRWANYVVLGSGPVGPSPSSTAGVAQISLTGGAGRWTTTAGASVSGSFRLTNMLNASIVPTVQGTNMLTMASSDQQMSMHSGFYGVATSMDAFRLLASSGNIASGTARCYGVAK